MDTATLPLLLGTTFHDSGATQKPEDNVETPLTPKTRHVTDRKSRRRPPGRLFAFCLTFNDWPAGKGAVVSARLRSQKVTQKITNVALSMKYGHQRRRFNGLAQ